MDTGYKLMFENLFQAITENDVQTARYIHQDDPYLVVKNHLGIVVMFLAYLLPLLLLIHFISLVKLAVENNIKKKILKSP